MQAVRLLDPTRASFVGKLVEEGQAGRRARDVAMTVLGLLLNLGAFGGNLEGVRAASLAYFGKEPTRLSRRRQHCSSRSRARPSG